GQLDVRDKHVGVAVADLGVERAEPYCVMHRKDTNSLLKVFCIREESVRGILVGVPVEKVEENPDLTQMEVFVKELPKIAELNDVRYAYWKDTLTLSHNVEYLLAPFQLDEKITEHVFERSAAAVLQ
nr:hypothetical protein [Tanacetum cinerariifolium]